MASFVKTNHTDPLIWEDLNHIVAGDFNGDGKQDFLAVRLHHADFGFTPVQSEVYLGDGLGQFMLAKDLFVGGNPTTNFASRAYAKDINGDGVRRHSLY